MNGVKRLSVAAALAFAVLALPLSAAADHGTRPHTPNMHALGHSPDFGSFLLPDGQRDANSDLAFWGNLVFHGDYDGFRILRDSPKAEPRSCDGTTVPAGFEGMHIWDISNLADPVLVGDVELSARPQADSPGCGTHTLTLVKDPDANRVIIYNATSGGNAALPNPGDGEGDWIDIARVPLGTPGAAPHVRREPLMGGHA